MSLRCIILSLNNETKNRGKNVTNFSVGIKNGVILVYSVNTWGLTQ